MASTYYNYNTALVLQQGGKMGLTERFKKEQEEIGELLTNIVNYHEIVQDLKEQAQGENTAKDDEE
jgi:hypothetical protein